MANTNNSSRFKYSESPCRIGGFRLGTIHHIENLHSKFPSTASRHRGASRRFEALRGTEAVRGGSRRFEAPRRFEAVRGTEAPRRFEAPKHRGGSRHRSTEAVRGRRQSTMFTASHTINRRHHATSASLACASRRFCESLSRHTMLFSREIRLDSMCRLER